MAIQYIYFKHSFVYQIRIYLYYSVPTIHEYRRPKIFVSEKFPRTEDRISLFLKNFRRPKTEYLRSWKISEDRRPNSTIRSQLFANTEESKYSVQLWPASGEPAARPWVGSRVGTSKYGTKLLIFSKNILQKKTIKIKVALEKGLYYLATIASATGSPVGCTQPQLAAAARMKTPNVLILTFSPVVPSPAEPW